MISIVIPTFNNKDQFLQNLKNNIIFFGKNEIIIVNDDPHMDLQPYLKQFPYIRLIQNNKNLGFSGAIDIGIRKAESDYIFLLNDDVLLLSNGYMKAVDNFKRDHSLFAVSFSQKEKNEVIVGKNILYWSKGLMHHSKAKDLKSGVNAWAEGGVSLIDKKKYTTLGGFDQLYNPFYWEDIDLSYQAWKQGYKIIFDSETIVIHYHESTISQNFSQQFIKTIAYRNQFIFIWKNISDINLILQHILLLPYNMLYYLYKGEKGFAIGFLAALKNLGVILEKRTYSNKKRVVSDMEILNQYV